MLISSSGCEDHSWQVFLYESCSRPDKKKLRNIFEADPLRWQEMVGWENCWEVVHSFEQQSQFGLQFCCYMERTRILHSFFTTILRSIKIIVKPTGCSEKIVFFSNPRKPIPHLHGFPLKTPNCLNIKIRYFPLFYLHYHRFEDQ